MITVTSINRYGYYVHTTHAYRSSAEFERRLRVAAGHGEISNGIPNLRGISETSQVQSGPGGSDEVSQVDLPAVQKGKGDPSSPPALSALGDF